MKRIYHHYKMLEENAHYMWRLVSGQEKLDYREKAIRIMRDPELFKLHMIRVIREWKYSCEHNLSAKTINRVAWLGHAGCCIAEGCPEECTRLGWHALTQSEQDEANRVAAEAVAMWDESHA